MACVPLAAVHILSSPRDQNFSKESFILAASPSSSMTLCLKHLICLLILLFYWNCIYHTKHSLFSYFTDSSSPFFFFSRALPVPLPFPFRESLFSSLYTISLVSSFTLGFQLHPIYCWWLSQIYLQLRSLSSELHTDGFNCLLGIFTCDL